MVRKLLVGLKRFFFPPPGTKRWLRVLPFAILGVLTFVVLSAGAYTWEYTNSTEFCGTSCHTMPPEYSAYLRSPHARVQCVECHIGRDVLTTQFSRKAGDLRHVVLMLTQQYEFPIHTHNMRPARDSCETCHFPEKFSDDSLVQIHNYKNDEANSLETIFLVLKTGGGSDREGLGRGIHWHIENEVWFYATDEFQQDIPYVRTVDENGVVAEYYDVGSGYTPETVAGKTLERMDCITCHNRVTHTIPTPEEAIDQAMSKSLIPTDIPFIREQIIKRFGRLYPTDADALVAIATLDDYYLENYPDLYAERKSDFNEINDVLSELYATMVFREQKIDWETHKNNLGHKNDPGCFRCHDGKHLTQEDEAIRLECNLCHAIPVVGMPGALTTNIELVSGPEPFSHTHTNWISLHSKAIDSSCIGCHAPNDPNVILERLDGQPPPDGSFCGNTACHGNVWEYTGFDNPILQPILERQLYVLQNTSPYILPGVTPTYELGMENLFNGRCSACHGGNNPEAGLDLTTYEGILAGGSSGPGIIMGDADASLIYQRQTGSPPHFGQMISDEIEALQLWILAGAPEQ
jgi:nitrate/TMAO reductase-like tetraheme cytochrome c subunit/mono/diheme cytochrome c family protein